MGQVFLFESGSTKTTLLVAVSDKSEVKFGELGKESVNEFALAGYNPNRPNSNFLNELKEIPIKSDDKVYFYGSGLSSEESKEDIKQQFQNLFKVDIKVYDDLQGAARALYGSGAGIVAILGTGGISAYFNNGEIKSRMGGYGYLIDDLGGGYELGKCLVSAWLSNQLPVELSQKIETQVKIKRSAFVRNYYTNDKLASSSDGLTLIAGLVKLIPAYQDESVVHNLLKEYFKHFFIKNIIPLSHKYNANEIRIVGSIGEIFKDIIHQVARELRIELTRTLRYPALNLLAYHIAEENKTTEIKNYD